MISLLTVAALYLIAVNAALNLPATRALVNGLQPEQFQVTWERAWSLYPLRLELNGVAADGQTPTEQWQVDAGHAAASISLLPLLQGEIRVHDLDLKDIDLRLRPRPTPEASADADADRNPLVAFYPMIRNRDPNAVAEAPPEASDGTLVLEIDDIHVQGEHRFWISHIRGSLPGAVRGSLRMESETGRLALGGGAIDLALTSLTVGPEEPITDAASIQGEIEIPPFRLSEKQGLELMRVPELDARIDLPVQNLDFIALLMPVLDELALSGNGRLSGRIALSAGEVLPGTDLRVEAHQLAMDIGPYAFSGDGSVEFKVDPDHEGQADLSVRFNQVRAELEPGPGPATVSPNASSREGNNAQPDAQQLFTGQGLTAHIHAEEVDPTTTSTAKQVEELAAEVALRFNLDIPSMEVPDLSVYSRLFPQDWDLSLLGGSGTLAGAVEIRSEVLSLQLDLASDEAELRYQDYHATTDLLLQLRARVDDIAGTELHMDGTTLRIEDAQVAVEQADDDGGEGAAQAAQPWRAELRIIDGDLSLPAPERAPGSGSKAQTETVASDPIPAVARTLKEQGFGALLADADGRLKAVLIVSELDWIAELLDRPLDLSLEGSGELDAEIILTNGQPDAGSSLWVPRERLSLALMQHRVDGQGSARLTLERGGDRPRFRLDVGLEDARMRRRDEPEPSIGEVRLDAEILVTDPLAGGGDTADLSLKLHSARVHDMSTYNAYLPENAPLSLLSGEASLVGDLRLKPDSAEGQWLLEAEDLQLSLSDSKLSGDLQVEILVRDGSAQDLRFDISGSSLRLDRVQVIGAAGSAQSPDWHARLQLEDTEVLWQKPMHLDMLADITVRDTRPFVALLDNVRGKHDWIGELLTMEDLAGHVQLAIEGETATIEDAMLSAPELGIHAKGRSTASIREAMLLLRWHNLSGAMEFQNEQQHFDIGNAQARFASYSPGKTPLPSLGTSQSGQTALPFADADHKAAGIRTTALAESTTNLNAQDETSSGSHTDAATETAPDHDHSPALNPNPFQDHSL
ncbi:MAG: hypothetical protein C1943_18165 [Halochromatium sp.]|nr:hypothetical protein [Halochromatium sp.]